VPFFIWVGIFNLVIVAQLWAFANDVYTVGEGKRLFAIVGFGASLGAIAGAFVTGQLVKQYGPYPFMLGAAALLVISMILTNLVNSREKRGQGSGLAPGDRADAAGAPATADPGEDRVKGRSGFALVFSDRYLLLIAVLMLVYNLVNTNGEYILGKTVVSQYAQSHGAAALGGIDEKKVVGEFYGNYFTIVNVLAAVIQAFLVSRIIKFFGVRGGLLVLPLVALIGYGAMAFIPILAIIRAAKIGENSLDYSLQSTARNALYLPTSREAKYKAKAAVDTFFMRFGDVLQGGVVKAGSELSVGLAGFAYVIHGGIPSTFSPLYREKLRRFLVLFSVATAALIVCVISDGVLTMLRLTGTGFSADFLLPILSLAIEIAFAGVLAFRIRGVLQHAAATAALSKA